MERRSLTAAACLLVTLTVPARAATRVAGKGEAAADFSLVTQDGRPFTLAKDGAGRAVVLTFIFSRCPGACPLVVEACVTAVRKAGNAKPGTAKPGKPPLVVAVSFDPEHDTPAKLKEYAQARGLSARQAVFLTGPAEAVKKVMADYGVTAAPSGASFDHNFITVVVGGDGKVVSRWEGSMLDEAQLAEDLRTGGRARGKASPPANKP